MTNEEKLREVFPRTIFIRKIEEDKTVAIICTEEWLKSEYRTENRLDILTCSTNKNDLAVDCISRDTAIKALDYDIKCFEFKPGVSKHMDDIAKLLNTIYETQVNNIKALPSVAPQESKWIPVNEKLPEDHKDVLAYLSSDRISICRYNSHKLPFCNNPIGWGYLYDAGFIDFEKENVIAWMPLPKEYKAESEDMK